MLFDDVALPALKSVLALLIRLLSLGRSVPTVTIFECTCSVPIRWVLLHLIQFNVRVLIIGSKFPEYIYMRCVE
jgi:hypothetical protein